MARIALKVDVDTLRGTREGVPRLLELLARAGASATFLFSLGPDHTGWALRRVFRPGFLSKVSRTSVLSHYGLRTLMYGVLLPAPDIGRVADSTPSDTPSTADTTSARPISSIVAGTAAPIVSRAPAPRLVALRPQSPRTNPDSQRQ